MDLYYQKYAEEDKRRTEQELKSKRCGVCNISREKAEGKWAGGYISRDDIQKRWDFEPLCGKCRVECPTCGEYYAVNSIESHQQMVEAERQEIERTGMISKQPKATQ